MTYTTRIVEAENRLHEVARAIASPMTTDTYQDAAGTDYHRMSVKEILSIASQEVVPLTQRLARAEAARGRQWHWYEQTLSDSGTVVAISETADPAEQLAHVPDLYSNWMMKQGRLFKISDEAQIIARANGLQGGVGTDELARQMAMQMTLLVRDTEKAILEAQLATTNPRQMRGLLGGFRTGSSNGWIGGVVTDTTLDLAAAEITSANVKKTINDYMLQLYNLHKGPMPNALYVPPRMLWLIQEAAFDRVQITMTQDELRKMAAFNLGGKVGFIYTDFGGLEVIAHPLLPVGANAGAAANSRLMFLYEPAIRLIDYVGHGGIHIEPRVKTGPVETRLISQIYTLEMTQFGSHGVISNFYVS